MFKNFNIFILCSYVDIIIRITRKHLSYQAISKGILYIFGHLASNIAM